MSATTMTGTRQQRGEDNPQPRGFRGLRCICCGDPDCVRVDIDNTSVFACSSCDGSFTAADVCEQVAAWEAVLSWCVQAPLLT